MKNLRKFSHEMLSGLKAKKNLVVAGATVVLGTAQAQAAAITPPDFTSNVTDLGILLIAMVGLGGLVWGARKLSNFAG
jgi:hypothetical protein